MNKHRYAYRLAERPNTTVQIERATALADALCPIIQQNADQIAKAMGAKSVQVEGTIFRHTLDNTHEWVDVQGFVEDFQGMQAPFRLVVYTLPKRKP